MATGEGFWYLMPSSIQRLKFKNHCLLLTVLLFTLFSLHLCLHLPWFIGLLIIQHMEYWLSVHILKKAFLVLCLPIPLKKNPERNKWRGKCLEQMQELQLETRANIDLLAFYLCICPHIYLPCNNTCALTSRIIVLPSSVWTISEVYVKKRCTVNMQRQPRACELMAM